MQIKKFTAPTLKQASLQMKQEFGGEAVILGTRVISNKQKPGNPRMFEITAGIEQLETIEASPASTRNKLPERSEKKFSQELENLSNKIFINSSNKKNNGNGAYRRVKQKDIVAERKQNIENKFKKIVNSLLNHDVRRSTVSSLVNQLKKYKNFLHPSNIDSYVLSSISSMIPTFPFEVQKGKKPKIVALIGPTGVGKTTCIAKLAVISKILHNLDVGLISIDTYRLGAVDQLRIFAEISNVDMLVAYEPRDMPRLINSFKNKDIIFIDTAGRSQNNKEHLMMTKQFLTAGKVDETYLVLSSTGTVRNLFDVVEKFKVFNYNSSIFTKIDEAVTFGNILNVVNKYDLPVSFLTNGQVIPDDIISADPEFIANMIYTGKIN